MKINFFVSGLLAFPSGVPLWCWQSAADQSAAVPMSLRLNGIGLPALKGWGVKPDIKITKRWPLFKAKSSRIYNKKINNIVAS
jgi:hypothetical protein